jgi:hypothetical protein
MRTTYTDFANNYIAKNGEKANQAVLGRPNLQLKIESDLNYEYIQAMLGNINVWNSTTIYLAGQIVKYNNGVYISQQDNNLNQTPDTANSIYWTYSSQLTLGCCGGGVNNLPMAIGNIHNPLLDIPLKNSLTMRSGVGSTTFSRSSTATYIDRYGVLQTASLDEPRFEKEGYLCEDTSTNLLTYSNQFNSDGGWTLTNATIKQNATGPDGADNSAWYLDETTGAGDSIVYKAGFSLTAGTTYTSSFFAKKAEDSEVYCWYSSAFFKDGVKRYVKYNFDTKVLTDVNNNLQWKNVVELANGWVRISMTFLVDNSTTGSVSVIGSLEDKDTTGSGVYIYGAQLEALPFATSYIPTTNSTVTRAADNLSVDSVGNSNGVTNRFSEETLVFDFATLGGSQDSYLLVFEFDGEPTAYRAFYNTSNSSMTLQYGADKFNGSHNVLTNNSLSIMTRYAMSHDSSGTVKIYMNGVFKAAGNSGNRNSTSPSSTIYIGGGAKPFGHISNFRIYDKALTDYEMFLA